MKKAWSKIRAGETVVLSGREWIVESVKTKKRAIRVEVRSGTHRASSSVDPSEKVKIKEAPAPPKPARKRPATPPRPAAGDPWETQSDRIEGMLSRILEATLVGEGSEKGYYVPPADLTTIAAHLAIFHGGIPRECRHDEHAMLAWHEKAHAGIDPLPTHHWHTERRP